MSTLLSVQVQTVLFSTQCNTETCWTCFLRLQPETSIDAVQIPSLDAEHAVLLKSRHMTAATSNSKVTQQHYSLSVVSCLIQPLSLHNHILEQS